MNNLTINLGQRALNLCTHLFSNNLFKKQLLLFWSFLLLFGLNNAFAQTTGNCTPDNNPAFPTECDFCVIVVLDESGSTSNIATQVKNAMISFATALNDPCLDVNMAIVEYGSQARIANIGGTAGFRNVNNDFVNDLTPYFDGGGNSASTYNSSGGTNWDQGLQVAKTLSDNQTTCANPYIVMFTDGNPTYYGTGPSGPGNSTTTAVLEAACNSANALKNNGSRIFTVALPNPSVVVSNVQAITDGGTSLEYVSGTPGAGQTNNIRLADYLITTSANVGTAFAALAAGIAAPTISTTAVSTDFTECNPTIPVPSFTVNHDCQNNATPTVNVQTSNNGCDYTRTYTATYEHVGPCPAVAEDVVITYTWTQDTEDPVITNCPAEAIDLGDDPQNLPTEADAENVINATDNCGIKSKVATAGQIQVDGCVSTQTFEVIVTDNCDQTATCNIVYTWTKDCCVDGVADDPSDVESCDEYVLPALTNGNYFTGPGGTGDALNAGHIITTTQTIYVYGPADAPCQPAENSFVVTINDTPLADDPSDVESCDEYVLPALTNGNYFTGPGGTGTALSSGDKIEVTQTIYVYTAAAGSCTDAENSFVVTINDSVEAGEDGSLVICEGGSITAELLYAQLTGADEGGSWSPEPSGAGTYTYTVYGIGSCSDDTATVEVTEQIIQITAGELVCGEQSEYGFYTADVTTNGGILTSDYGTLVDNGGNSWTITNIPNGQNVTVTVTTDLQCESSLEIEAPDCFCIELYYEYTNVSCYGLDDGTIVVTSVSEGATVTINGQPYDANMLYAPGSYTIKAFYEGVDIDVCIFEEKIDITEPDLVTINAVGTDVTCYGANDGTITVSNLSAGAVYTIKKNGIGADLSGQTYFSPGMYIVKAFLPASDPISGGGQSRSYNPCESIVIVNIKQPNMLACKLYSGFGTYVDCKPTSTTNWLGVKTTGQGQLTYSWTINAKGIDNGWGIVENDPEGFVNLIVGVGSAIYTVTIEDENGCVTSCSREVVSSCEKEDPLFNATLYPNPVKDILNVKFDKQVDGDVTIEVYNLVGTKMFGNTFNSNTKHGKNDMKIDFSRFPSHVYYVKIITKQGTLIKKVVLDK